MFRCFLKKGLFFFRIHINFVVVDNLLGFCQGVVSIILSKGRLKMIVRVFTNLLQVTQILRYLAALCNPGELQAVNHKCMCCLTRFLSFFKTDFFELFSKIQE